MMCRPRLLLFPSLSCFLHSFLVVLIQENNSLYCHISSEIADTLLSFVKKFILNNIQSYIV